MCPLNLGVLNGNGMKLFMTDLLLMLAVKYFFGKILVNPTAEYNRCMPLEDGHAVMSDQRN